MPRTPSLAVLIAGLALLTPGSVADAASPMQPGMWEITARLEMAGMPTQQQTVNDCIQNTQSPEEIIPTQDDCTIETRGIAGNRLSWTMRCQQGTAVMDGTGEMTMSATTYEAVMQMAVTEGGQTMRMTSRYSGRRVGDC